MQSLRSLQFVLIYFVAAGCVFADIEIVREGAPAADIITGADPNIAVKWAALDLQEHIEKMSGARLEIVNAPSDNFKTTFMSGQIF